MAMLNSKKLTKRANQCITASRLARFLESTQYQDGYYDFIAHDLLYFNDQKALEDLRQNESWLKLEDEFCRVCGLISEGWDEEKYPPFRKEPIQKIEGLEEKPSISLGIITIIICLAIGGFVGGYFGHQRIPFTAEQLNQNR